MNPLHYVDGYWEMYSRWLGDSCQLADSLHDLMKARYQLALKGIMLSCGHMGAMNSS